MVPTPLHTRSRHSLGFGTASVEELAARAASLGIPSLALTDIETLAGQIRFHDACAERGIKPITGLELRCGHERHSIGSLTGRLILLARDDAGYATLCRTVSRRRSRPHADGDGDPLVALEEGSAGVFLLTDDADLLGRLLQLDSVDRDSVRLLLVRPAAGANAASATAERFARDAAAAMGVPLVADLDLVTLDAQDRDLHALLIAIRHGVTVAEVQGSGLDTAAERTFDAGALALFTDVPEAVRQTHVIANACTLDLRSSPRVPPRLPELSGDGAVAELRARCMAALVKARSEPGGTGSATAGTGTLDRRTTCVSNRSCARSNDSASPTTSWRWRRSCSAPASLPSPPPAAAPPPARWSPTCWGSPTSTPWLPTSSSSVSFMSGVTRRPTSISMWPRSAATP